MDRNRDDKAAIRSQTMVRRLDRARSTRPTERTRPVRSEVKPPQHPDLCHTLAHLHNRMRSGRH